MIRSISFFKGEDFDGPRYSRVFPKGESSSKFRMTVIQKYLPLFASCPFLGMRLSSIASPAGLVGAPLKKRVTQQDFHFQTGRAKVSSICSLRRKATASASDPGCSRCCRPRSGNRRETDHY